MTTAWMDSAACTQVDPILWDTDFPDGNHDAVAVCATCPVKQVCGDYANANAEPNGIWAGKDRRPGMSQRFTRDRFAQERVELRGKRISAAHKARRDAFIAEVEAAIANGETAANFCKTRDLNRDTLRTRLRRADRHDLITQWRDHNPTYGDDTPKTIAARRHQAGKGHNS